MISVSVAGIGGQGNVLAAKILAQAAKAKGWQVRTAETIGMAQRGGDVISHVRMGNNNEEVYAPLPAKGTVDVIIALEPGEGARALPYLKQNGLLVVAKSGVAPSTADLKADPYNPDEVIVSLEKQGVAVSVMDDQALCEQLGTRKALNIMMLAHALNVVNNDSRFSENELCGAISLDDMRDAIVACVKEKFVTMNLNAVDLVLQSAKV